MTHEKYIIERKMNIVELSEKLGNISLACRTLGVSRQHYYNIKGAIEEDGLEGLLEKAKNKPRFKNRISSEVEKKILNYSLEYLAHGQVTVANEFKKERIIVSASGVRRVWLREGLTTKALRLKRLAKYSLETSNILTEAQVNALENAKEEKQACGEIETHHPSFLLRQDTYYVGHIKGIGKIYQQTGIDTYSNVGFVKLYTEKIPVTVADFLNSKVFPYFDIEGMKVLRVLTDQGTEYGWKNLEHPYQFFLHLCSVEHTRTKAGYPQTNGCVECLNQIIQDEFYRVVFRKKIYRSLDEMQVDIDKYMGLYNNKRTNQGKRCHGRTPRQICEEIYKLYKKYMLYDKGEIDIYFRSLRLNKKLHLLLKSTLKSTSSISLFIFGMCRTLFIQVIQIIFFFR